MDPTRDWQLLISILPHVLPLAEFYTENDAEAVAARAEVDRYERCRDPFYANFYVELQNLKDNAESRDTTLDLPGESISRVLELLESRCFVFTWLDIVWRIGAVFQSTPKGYRNLEKLLQQIDAVHDSNPTPRDLINKLRFSGLRKAWRDEIIRHLTACNQALSSDFSRGTQVSPVLSFDAVLRKSKKAAKAILYSHERRELEDKVHQVLIEHWHCCCPAKHAEAHLLLQPQTTSDEEFDARYEVWFCGLTKTSDHAPTLTWQEADIFVCPSQGRNNRKNENADAKTMDSKGKAIISSTLKSTNSSTTTGADGPPWEVDKDICELVNKAVKLTPRRLHFIVNNDVLHWDFQSPTHDSHQHEFISLNKIIADSSSSVFTRETQLSKYLLSYLLASSFLRICGGPWSPNAWTKDQISFHRYPSKVINIRRPYLTTFLASDTMAQQSINKMQIQKRIHPYPQILALGMLLLQIWLGKPIEAERSDDNPNRTSDPESYDIDADRTVAQRMLASCKDNCLPLYTKAIKACLETHTFRSGQSFGDKAFRKNIYQEIVRPIEKTVLTYEVNVDDKTVFAAYPGIQENMGKTPQLEQIESPEVITQVGNPPSSSKKMPNESAIGGSADAECNPDAWFQSLGRFVHPCLNIKKSTAERSLDPRTKIITRNGRVRIAILDTGLELPVFALNIYKDRIKDFRDWVAGGEGTPWVDLDGHGTHSAGLILKVAPEADLYVARVFEKQGTGKDVTSSNVTKSNIANAIRHAVDTWRVDIISMSFGFPKQVSVIESQISYAYKEGVLMIAAASNDGGNSKVAWPARRGEVLCIHAADGKGNKGPFTPSPRPNAENFIVPGINVQSVWPPHLQQGSRVRKSGTSCATPIAAGVAAIVLDIASLYLATNRAPFDDDDESNWRNLRSVAGMSLAFKNMSEPRDGYNYILPWKFIGKLGLKVDTAMDILLRNLKDEL